MSQIPPSNPERSRFESVIPTWAKALRAALPEEGTVKILIPGRPSARYLDLSRSDIDAAAQALRARRLRRRSRSRAVLRGTESGWQRAGMGAAGVLGVLLIALGGIWLDRGHTERILAEERDAALERELAFEAYLSATRHLLAHDNAQVRSELQALRIEPEAIFSTTSQARMTGGNEGEDGVFQTLRSRMDETHETLLLDNLDLREFLTHLPSTQPLPGARISSTFGLRRHPVFRTMQHHDGVDFISSGDPTVVASQSGTVTLAARSGGYGLTVEITNDFGVITRYAHLRRFLVQAGDRIEAGDPIGIMGSTGLSTGPHLHYEVLVKGIPVNPLQTLRMAQNALEDSPVNP